MAVFGLVCSSFVTISAGTHKRTPWNPLGDTSVEMVAKGNKLASVTFVYKLMLLQHMFVFVLGGEVGGLRTDPLV